MYVSVNGFSSPHRLDRKCNGGCIILYIREDIQSKLLSIEGQLTEAFLLKLIYTTRKNGSSVVLITQREL